MFDDAAEQELWRGYEEWLDEQVLQQLEDA